MINSSHDSSELSLFSESFSKHQVQLVDLPNRVPIVGNIASKYSLHCETLTFRTLRKTFCDRI